MCGCELGIGLETVFILPPGSVGHCCICVVVIACRNRLALLRRTEDGMGLVSGGVVRTAFVEPPVTMGLPGLTRCDLEWDLVAVVLDQYCVDLLMLLLIL